MSAWNGRCSITDGCEPIRLCKPLPGSSATVEVERIVSMPTEEHTIAVDQDVSTKSLGQSLDEAGKPN